MVCPERELLAREYREAVDAFRDSVFALKDLHGFEFDREYRKSALRRIAVDKARIALDHHLIEHEC